MGFSGYFDWDKCSRGSCIVAWNRCCAGFEKFARVGRICLVTVDVGIMGRERVGR